MRRRKSYGLGCGQLDSTNVNLLYERSLHSKEANMIHYLP
jgi:hypothetical protein